MKWTMIYECFQKEKNWCFRICNSLNITLQISTSQELKMLAHVNVQVSRIVTKTWTAIIFHIMTIFFHWFENRDLFSVNCYERLISCHLFVCRTDFLRKEINLRSWKIIFPFWIRGFRLGNWQFSFLQLNDNK